MEPNDSMEYSLKSEDEFADVKISLHFYQIIFKYYF